MYFTIFWQMSDVIIKVACGVQIWKKTFCQNSDKFGYFKSNFNEHFFPRKDDSFAL